MSADISGNAPKSADDRGVEVLIADCMQRISRLEDEGRKTAFKRLTTSASTSALILGLILTFASLYNTFITDPHTTRVNQLAAFNDAVNAINKVQATAIIQQEEGHSASFKQQEQMLMNAEAANYLSTALAMSKELTNTDVGIPQLITLVNSSLELGDLNTAQKFVKRAIKMKDVTPYLKSEAKRSQGRFCFAAGDPVTARKAYTEAIGFIANYPGYAAERAFILSDEIVNEAGVGDCAAAVSEFALFSQVVQSQMIGPPVRNQLGSSLATQWAARSQRCPIPTALAGLAAPS